MEFLWNHLVAHKQLVS